MMDSIMRLKERRSWMDPNPGTKWTKTGQSLSETEGIELLLSPRLRWSWGGGSDDHHGVVKSISEESGAVVNPTSDRWD